MSIILITSYYSSHVQAEKTKIEVQYSNEAALISQIFINSASTISSEMKQEFTNSLNEYIPFFEFTNSSTRYRIVYVLADTSIDKGLRLIIKFYDATNLIDRIEFELFNNNEYYDYKNSANTFIDKYKSKWKNWLQVNYNNMLVNHFFTKIPIRTLDSDFYYVEPDNSSRFIILPFDTCTLHLTLLGGTKFWLYVEYKDTQNTLRKKPIENAIIYGVVDASMPDKNVEFNGDVTIDVTPLSDINAFQKGLFKIMYYDRVKCNSIFTPSDY